ncbi:hypothetical protein F1880_002822 [Penicillium rolfsii]|nr:hypothetical protein F1880_002822 [Penicillium rolfsii]
MHALDPFFGVTEGLLSPGPPTECTTIIHAWKTPPGEIQWLDPETLETLKEQPPHIQIMLSHSTTVLAGETSPLCETQSDYVLPRDTLTAIVTAIHNRVYQAGFENQTIFPVLLFSDYYPDRMRIIEAVFDIILEKLNLRITPTYTFGDPETAPWDIFMRMHASTPRVSSFSGKYSK